jgi:hypothetical protein
MLLKMNENEKGGDNFVPRTPVVFADTQGITELTGH